MSIEASAQHATGDVTVLVPTAGRPELLEVTLRSVARQTAVSRIASVVVSENLGNRGSEAVCAAFPQLPITYLFQDPQLTVQQHVGMVLRLPETEFMALVCDDDLWSPGHLQAGLVALEENPAAVACFSGCVQSSSELGPDAAINGAKLLWLAAGRPPRMALRTYDLAAVLSLCWVDTPFSWSTIVGRSAEVAASAHGFENAGHAFYADRLLYPALAKAGDILYDPAIDTVYRLYPGNWQSSQEDEHLGALARQAWAEVDELAQQAGVDLAAQWRSYLRHMPEEWRDELAIELQRRFSNEDLLRYGLDESIPLVPPPPEPPPPPPPLPWWKLWGGRVKRAWLDLRGVEHWHAGDEDQESSTE